MTGIQHRQSIDDNGKYTPSVQWITSALDVTKPWAARHEVICSDDCEHCPLALRGCQTRCIRWDNLVCSDCPCLGSRHTDHTATTEIRTVNPKTGESEPPRSEVLAVHSLRRRIPDGMRIPVITKRSPIMAEEKLPPVSDQTEPMMMVAAWIEAKKVYERAEATLATTVEYLNNIRERMLDHGVTLQLYFPPGQTPVQQAAPATVWQQPPPEQAQIPPAPRTGQDALDRLDAQVHLPPMAGEQFVASGEAEQIQFGGTTGVEADGYIHPEGGVAIRVQPVPIRGTTSAATRSFVDSLRGEAGVATSDAQDDGLRSITAARFAEALNSIGARG